MQENELIAEYIIPMFPRGETGVFLDIGAYDPEWLSNSYPFEELGWSCFCIEPNPNCIPLLLEKRKNVIQCAVGDSNSDNVSFFIKKSDFFTAGPLGEASESGLTKIDGDVKETMVSVRTVDWIMENVVNKDHIDVISIDVEGSEQAVLNGISISKWNPKVAIIENINESKSIRDWMEMMGYGMIKRVSYNDIYVRLSEIKLRIG